MARKGKRQGEMQRVKQREKPTDEIDTELERTRGQQISDK